MRTIAFIAALLAAAATAHPTSTGPRFAGKKVLVTGGSSGIGKATAIMFAEECAAEVHIVARAAGQLKAAKEEIEAADRSACSKVLVARGGSKASDLKVIIHSVDLSDIAAVNAMFDQIDDLDAAVNAAGVGGYGGNLADVPDDVWGGPHDAIANNVYATLFATQGEVRIFLKHNKTGAIVNLSSGQGLVGCQGCAMYSASKHAIVGITQSVALEVADSKIRVNAIAPGLIETPLTWNQARAVRDPNMQSYQCKDKDGHLITANYTCDEGCACPNIPSDDPDIDVIRKGYNAQCPMKRTGQPEEVAALALYLASDESSYTTGSVMKVDGGVLAQ